MLLIQVELLTFAGKIVPDCNLSTDMATLVDGSLFSDVTLAVGRTEVKAHKAILAGMSCKN